MNFQRNRIFGTAAVVLISVCSSLTPARGQLWYRDAIIAPMSAATFEKQQPRGAVKIGPVVLDLSTQVFVDYSDNEFLAPIGQAGSHLGAGVTVDAIWNAARGQQLKIGSELTRRQTLTGPTKSRSFLTISPGSALRYTAYVKDVRFTPFLNLSRQDNPLLAATVNNTDSYRQTTYDAGLQTDWQLNNLTLQSMVLRGRRTSFSDAQNSQDADRAVASFRVVRTLSPALDLGADVFNVAQDYRDGPAARSTTQTASVFTRTSLSRAVQLKGAVGLTKTASKQSRLLDDSSGATSLFNEVDLSHRVRPNLNYSLRYNQTVGDGVSTNYISTRQLTLAPALTLSDRLVLRAEADWQWVRESARSGESGGRRSYLAKLEWTTPLDVLMRLTARDIIKSSSLPSRIYAQRYFEINLSKQF